MTPLALLRLEHELSLWRTAGHRPSIWWRDDDARTPSLALDRLLAVRGGLPLSLAVIPDVDLQPLSARLKTEAGLTISQHGVDHQNRRPWGEPRSEYPRGESPQLVAQSVAAARAKLELAGLAPVFYTPPWNSFDETLLGALKAAGYRVFSAGIYGRPAGGLDHVGAEVDVLRWRGDPPVFKGKVRIFALLRRQLARRRKARAWSEPVGILTHHLVHDAATWDFLAWFAPWSDARFNWRGFAEIEAERKAELQPA